MPVSNDGSLSLDKANSNIRQDDEGVKKRPKGIIDAISEIQHYHVFETQQESDINKNFFTLRQVFDYFKIGFKSGFVESLMFVLFLPFLQTIYPSFKFHFLKEEVTLTEQLILWGITYVPIVVMTIWLSLLFRLYDGAITKKAIFSLLSGRSFAFLLKSIIVFYLFAYLYELAMYDRDSTYVMISYLNTGITNIFMLDYAYQDTDLFIYYYQYIVPAIETISKQASLSMFIFASVPFFTVVGKGIYVTFKRKKGETLYEQY